MNTVLNKFKNNLSLSLTIINLLLFIIVFLQKDPLSLFVKSYETSDKFFDLKQSDITKVIYGRKNEESSNKELFIDNSEWSIKTKDGISTFADSEKINQLLKALLEARKFTIAATGKDKFGDYGLENNDAIEIQIYSGETQKGKLTLGNAGGGGAFTHVIWNDSDDIYIIEDSLKPLLGRGADDFFFNKRISPTNLSSGDLISISLKSKDSKKNYDLEKKDEKWFKILNKEEIPMDLISPLLNKISSLIADTILTEKNIPKLDSNNYYNLSYKYKEQTTGIEKSITLEILGKDNSDSFYLKKSNDNLIYKIQDYQLKKIIEF
jgi:hypothetical protein